MQLLATIWQARKPSVLGPIGPGRLSPGTLKSGSFREGILEYFGRQTTGSGTESGDLVGAAPGRAGLVRIRLGRSAVFNLRLTAGALDPDIHLAGP